MRGNKTNLREVTKMRPLNCDPGPHDADAPEKIRTRCPDCNQFHLRPGYCQAKDDYWKQIAEAKAAKETK